MSDEQPPAWKVAAVVGFYMVVALTMVFVNKWVLQNADLPLTFLFFQLLMSVLLIYAWGAIKSTSWSSPAWSPAMARKMVPVSAVNVVGLVFNIYCLKLVDASYFQVARGLVLPFTIALQAFIPGGARPTSLTLICCALVTWGFTYSFLPFPVGAGLVPEAPALGMLLGVLSAAMIAMHAVLIKTSLRHVDGSTLDLAYWTNILSLAAITPGVVISGEIARFVRLLAGREGDLRAFAVGSAVTGVVGFLICIAGLLSIKITSPVTHMFSSAARTVLQTILGVQLFRDVLNLSRTMSIALITAGTLLYTWHKSQSAPPPPAASSSEKLLADDEKSGKSPV